MTTKAELVTLRHNLRKVEESVSKLLEEIGETDDITLTLETDKIERIVKEYVIKCGIPVSSIGYSYIVSALIIGLDIPMAFQVRGGAKEIYKAVARKHNVKWTRVKDDIMYIIDVFLKNKNILLERLFKDCYTLKNRANSITASEYMALSVEYLRLQIRDQSLKELQRNCLETNKLIQNVMENETIEQSGIQIATEYKQLQRNFQKVSQLTAIEVRNEAEKEDVEIVVTKLIDELGIPNYVKGYKYLITAVKLAIRDNNILKRLDKDLYPKIGEEFKKSPNTIKQAIRRTIITSYDSSDPELIYKIFGNNMLTENDYPTSKKYIAGIVNFLLRNHKFA